MKNLILSIWQLPQLIVGWVMLCFYEPDKVDLLNKKFVIYSKRMRGGISLGQTIILGMHYYNDGTDIDERHEWGHTRQSLYLGPLYLLVIGLPSLLWAAFYNGDKRGYYKGFYTERWADKLAGIIR